MKKSLGVKAGKSLPTLNLRLRQQAEKWIFWKDAMEDISLTPKCQMCVVLLWICWFLKESGFSPLR